MSRAISQLNERSSEVLRQIVDAYLATGEAVGSRTLSRNFGMELSPATIRNVMADLQDSGLLFSPHASAGRIPTEAGLRLFVDGLLEVGHLTEEERLTIEAQCAAEGRSVQQALSEATRVLSGLSNCAGLVVAPKSDSALRHIEFVSLAPGRAILACCRCSPFMPSVLRTISFMTLWWGRTFSPSLAPALSCTMPASVAASRRPNRAISATN